MQLSALILAAQVGCGRLAFSSGICWLNVSYGQINEVLQKSSRLNYSMQCVHLLEHGKNLTMNIGPI